MKIKRLTKDKRQEWLKWLFSFKTITVIAGLIIGAVAAYYTYKSYLDNKPPQLGIEIRDYEKSINVNVEHIHFFRNFYIPCYDLVFLSSDNEFKPNGIPFVYNNSSKIMNNFKLRIHVVYTQYEITHICSDYKITNLDTIRDGLYKIMDLEYRSDVLYAQSAIPVPFSSMSISESDSLSEERFAWARLCYDIAFDGIPKPKSFEVNYYSYFDEYEDFYNYGNPEDFEDEYIEKILSDYYSEDYEFSMLTLVSVLDNDVTKFVIPPKKFTDEKFEKFKKDFVEDFKKQKNKKQWYDEE